MSEAEIHVISVFSFNVCFSFKQRSIAMTLYTVYILEKKQTFQNFNNVKV